MNLRHCLDDFFSLIYPENCCGCGHTLLSNETVLCTACRLNLAKTYNYRETASNIQKRIKGRLDVKYIFTFLKFTKEGITQRLLHQLKYHNATEVGVLLGAMYGAELASHGFSHTFDVLVPVPIHASRLKNRGYNQSEIIAGALAGPLNAKLLTKAVVKQKATVSQTKFSGQKRWNNAQDVFVVRQPAELTGKHVLLVDDVITTGATLESLGNEILKSRPKSISLLAIAEA